MPIRSLRNCLLATLALSLVSSIAWAQARPQAQGTEQGNEFHWKGKLAPENVVEIKDINGNIEAEAASGDEIEVTAEKSGPHADQVKIGMVQHSDGITFCVLFPGMNDHERCDQNGHEHFWNRDGERVKVNFHVRVPENIRFSGENVNGDVRATSLGRFVRASSVNGSVRVSTKSWAEVSSGNGDVEARMGSADWTGTLRIETVNGSIKLEFPGDLSTDVAFKSVNGKLDSDFPLTVQGSFGGHSVQGRIGNGGRDLKLETVNGSAQLRRNSI
jgi:putative adhesin